jgi:hypothetical protein
MPRARSRAMSASMCACDARTPSASSRRSPPTPRTSYQARITAPWLIVTARIGACGKTKRTGTGGRSSGTIGAKS